MMNRFNGGGGGKDQKDVGWVQEPSGADQGQKCVPHIDHPMAHGTGVWQEEQSPQVMPAAPLPVVC